MENHEAPLDICNSLKLIIEEDIRVLCKASQQAFSSSHANGTAGL